MKWPLHTSQKHLSLHKANRDLWIHRSNGEHSIILIWNVEYIFLFYSCLWVAVSARGMEWRWRRTKSYQNSQSHCLWRAREYMEVHKCCSSLWMARGCTSPPLSSAPGTNNSIPTLSSKSYSDFTTDVWRWGLNVCVFILVLITMFLPSLPP